MFNKKSPQEKLKSIQDYIWKHFRKKQADKLGITNLEYKEFKLTNNPLIIKLYFRDICVLYPNHDEKWINDLDNNFKDCMEYLADKGVVVR